MGNQKKWWQSTNFYIAMALFIAGLFTGIPKIETASLVQSVFAVFAAAVAFRDKVSNPKLDWQGWLKEKNTWNYLSVMLVALVPTLSPQFAETLRSLFDNINMGNWQGAITAVFSVLTMLWYAIRGGGTAGLATEKK